MQLEIPTKNVYSWWERQTPFIFIQSHEVCRCFATQWTFKTEPFLPSLLSRPQFTVCLFFWSFLSSLSLSLLSLPVLGDEHMKNLKLWGSSLLYQSLLYWALHKLLINLQNSNAFVQSVRENKRQAAGKISGVVVAEAQFLQRVAEDLPPAI